MTKDTLQGTYITIPLIRAADSRHEEGLEADGLAEPVKISDEDRAVLDIHAPAGVAIRGCAQRSCCLALK